MQLKDYDAMVEFSSNSSQGSPNNREVQRLKELEFEEKIEGFRQRKKVEDDIK
jgi:hypothetical protein